MAQTWRYIAQRALTGEFLHWDLPINAEEVRWDLSGPGAFRGTITPEVANMRAPDGDLILDEWGTFIYAEADGEIRWGGVIVSSSFDGPTWAVEAMGLSGYPVGIPYTSHYRGVNVDPFEAVALIWAHVQSQPDGNIGMRISPPKSPVKLGKPGIPKYTEVYVDGRWQKKNDVPASKIDPPATAPLAKAVDIDDRTITLKRLDKFGDLKLPFAATIGREKILVQGRDGLKLTGLFRGVDNTERTKHYVGTNVAAPGTDSRDIEAVAPEFYELAWWEAKDCGEELNNLASETPFDYAERHWWAGDEIAHAVDFGYPRLGRRRTDLAFIQGDNVVNVVPISRPGDEYANEVFGIGKGEGSKALRAQAATRGARLRRPKVYTDKSVTTTGRLSTKARAELDRRSLIAPEIATVTVINHPNARIGSWAVGDDVLIEARIPWVGDVAIWHRITSWSLETETRATLTLARSDSFRYGVRPENGE